MASERKERPTPGKSTGHSVEMRLFEFPLVDLPPKVQNRQQPGPKREKERDFNRSPLAFPKLHHGQTEVN